MEYLDQTRKLFAKLKIIYQDANASYEIEISTSGDSRLSYPSQVYQGYVAPTVKACTMDGNSTMNSEYQMIDYDCIMGWWSNQLSKSDGTYDANPYLEMAFIKRPVNTWTITGDVKLNQYPVDFDLIAYDENGSEICKKSIVGNDSVSLRVKFEEPLEAVKKMRIVVKKWNTASAVVKILQFFDILEENYEGSDIKQFEVLEELATDGEGVSYGINSDTLSVTIYNRERKFDQGYLKDFLLLDRKVIPFIGIENENGEVDYTQLGVFYSDEWSVPQNDQWVKLKCYDRLLKFQKMTYIGYPFTANVTLKTITKDILESAGLVDTDFEIDNTLDQIVIPYAFLGKKSVWDALQDVCNAGLCRIYTTRENKVKVSIENLDVPHCGLTIRPNRVFSYELKTRKTDFSNHIEVDYTDINASLTSSTQETVYSALITIDANSKRTMIVDYSSDVTDAFLTYLPVNNIQLNFFRSSINCGKFELENTSNSTIVVSVEIKGLTISVNTQTVIIEDEESVENYGVMSYKHASSDLVQTYARAVEIGEYLMRVLNQGAGTLSIQWRGNPALLLEDKFSCVNRFNVTKEYLALYNRFIFDGGLKQETKAREV